MPLSISGSNGTVNSCRNCWFATRLWVRCLSLARPDSKTTHPAPPPLLYIYIPCQLVLGSIDPPIHPQRSISRRGYRLPKKSAVSSQIPARVVLAYSLGNDSAVIVTCFRRIVQSVSSQEFACCPIALFVSLRVPNVGCKKERTGSWRASHRSCPADWSGHARRSSKAHVHSEAE